MKTISRQFTPSSHGITRMVANGAAQRGFSIVSAIFLLVVLAVLGAAIVNVSTIQSVTSNQDLQGSRAYHAARAGVEWGVYQVMNPSDLTYALPACPADATMTIEGFSVLVQCVRSPAGAAVYNELGSLRSIVVYQLTATASSGGAVGSLNYVERQIAVTVSKCKTTETGVVAQC